MFWTLFKRVIRGGFTHFYRNGFVSLASVLVMTVTLLVIGSVVFLSATLNASLEELKNKVDVNVYFQTSAPEEEVLALAERLRALQEVTVVEYISRERALLNFRERHQNDALTLQALAELPDNPLGALLNIRAKEPSQYEGIAQFLKSEDVLSVKQREIIDEVNYFDNKTAIDTLGRIIDSAEALGFGITLVLVVVSFIIAFNTIRLAIYISREEIAVMRLVGASNHSIRGPFVISGVLYGASAAILTLVAFYPLAYYLGDATEQFLSGLNLFRYYLAHFGEFFLIIVGSGVGLGAFSSFWAVRRYLNV
ncbi:MAG: Cell division protein FtsX [Parcubacteria group bacterium Greene0416_79]|nr:MAG: Cell division protein FtsX [Parcubacteria group bacterium Greene0416_79]